MANDLNSVNLIGRLTKDPITKSANGKVVSNFTIAINNFEISSFVDCLAWDKLAEISAQYLQKGKRVAISGMLQQQLSNHRR